MSNEQPQETSMALSPRQERAIAARDAMGAGARPAALVPTTFLEAQALCAALATSDLVPQKLKDHAADVLVIVMSGIEVGLAPMQSLRLHHVIEGIPRLSADGIASIVMASPLCLYLECIESTDQRCTWTTQRRGRPAQSCTWTIERAKRAGLVDKKNRDGSPGMWMKYPENMLSSRAKSEICRLVYPDLVAGLYSTEEARDGALDAEWTEVKPFVAPPAPPPVTLVPPPGAQTAAELRAAADPNGVTRTRGPGRPPKERQPIEVAANEPAPAPAPTKLEEAYAKVDAKAAPPGGVATDIWRRSEPPAPPVVVAPAPSTNGAAGKIEDEPTFGEDPVDSPPTKSRSVEQFFAWLASCRDEAALNAGKDVWIRWSKDTFATGSPEAMAMQKGFAAKKAEVVR